MAFSVPPYCLDIPCKTSSGKQGVESPSGGRREYRNTGGIKLSDKKMESRAVRSYSLCKRVWLNRHINGHWKAGSTVGRNNCGKEHQDLNGVRGDREMRRGNVL